MDERKAARGSQVDAVTFDVGHTLLFPDYRFYQQVLGDLGVSAEIPAIRKAEAQARAPFEAGLAQSANPYRLFFGCFLQPLGLAEGHLDEALRRIGERDAENALFTEVEPEAAMCLTALKGAGIRLAVISNADARVNERLERAGLRQYFEMVLDSTSLGVEKPAAAIFTAAAEQLGVSPRKVLHVGDYPTIDAAGARAAGMLAVTFDPMGIYPRAAPRISKLSHLLTMVRGAG